MNSSQEDANTVSEYDITQRSAVGNYNKNPRIDLLSVVMIRLPKDEEWNKAKNPATRLTQMLATLLSNQIGTDVIGIYPLLPDNTCRFLVFDFDNHEKP